MGKGLFPFRRGTFSLAGPARFCAYETRHGGLGAIARRDVNRHKGTGLADVVEW